MQGLGRRVDGEVLEGRDPGRSPTAGRGPRGAKQVVGEALAEHEVLHLGLGLQTVGVDGGYLQPGTEMAEKCNMVRPYKVRPLHRKTLRDREYIVYYKCACTMIFDRLIRIYFREALLPRHLRFEIDD